MTTRRQPSGSEWRYYDHAVPNVNPNTFLLPSKPKVDQNNIPIVLLYLSGILMEIAVDYEIDAADDQTVNWLNVAIALVQGDVINIWYVEQ